MSVINKGKSFRGLLPNYFMQKPMAPMFSFRYFATTAYGGDR